MLLLPDLKKEMEIIDILEENMTGDPIKDAVIMGILFVIFWTFYETIFGAVFSIFKKD